MDIYVEFIFPVIQFPETEPTTATANQPAPFLLKSHNTSIYTARWSHVKIVSDIERIHL